MAMFRYRTMEELIIRINGKEHKVKIEETEEGKIKVHHGKEVYEVETKAEVKQHIAEEFERKEESKESNVVVAPLPGTVSSVNVKKGSVVKKGKSILKLIAMKMENDIISEINGIVKEVKVKKNDTVKKGDVLVVLRSD